MTGEHLSDERIEDFLTRYEEALGAYDAQASAALWGTPGMLISDEFAGALDSRDEMARGLASGYPLYRELGLDRVAHTVRGIERITGRIARVSLTWHFFAGAEKLVDGEYQYLLRDDDDGLHAYVGVSIDEYAKLMALAAERGIELGP